MAAIRSKKIGEQIVHQSLDLDQYSMFRITMITVGSTLHEGSGAAKRYPAVEAYNRRFVCQTENPVEPFFDPSFLGKVKHGAACDSKLGLVCFFFNRIFKPDVAQGLPEYFYELIQRVIPFFSPYLLPISFAIRVNDFLDDGKYVGFSKLICQFI
jgi:hypothetical protein